MGWFSKKTYEKAYAERLYEALAVPELGDMTPERLRLPKQTPAIPREGTVLSRAKSACALLLVRAKTMRLCQRCGNTRASLRPSDCAVGCGPVMM
jgi:hypothetical protein